MARHSAARTSGTGAKNHWEGSGVRGGAQIGVGVRFGFKINIRFGVGFLRWIGALGIDVGPTLR